MKRILCLLMLILIVTFGYSQKLTYSKDYNGNTVAKDEYGNMVATGSTNYNRDFVWKDKYGTLIKNESKDYNGNNGLLSELKKLIPYLLQIKLLLIF